MTLQYWGDVSPKTGQRIDDECCYFCGYTNRRNEYCEECDTVICDTCEYSTPLRALHDPEDHHNPDPM